MIILIVCLAIIILLIAVSFFTVTQQTVALVERLGKFSRLAHAGLNFKIPGIDRVAGRVSLRISQLGVDVETKTLDNVFVKIQVSVQYRVQEDQIFNAFYKLQNGHEQITSFVFDVVRAKVPTMKLDDVFENKDVIAGAVKEELTETMQGFGYEIVKALVTDINPDAKVKNAMNEINEQQRLRLAASEKGEAEKILKVKQAEAEAESMRLNGEGLANQRKAIIEGFSKSVAEFQRTTQSDITPADIINMILTIQYFDTLKEIGANNKSSSILLPHTPGFVRDISNQLKENIISSNLASEKIV
jgi:regulator of protease activity HflC (stomatin/prohibitin superfamily)